MGYTGTGKYKKKQGTNIKIKKIRRKKFDPNTICETSRVPKTRLYSHKYKSEELYKDDLEKESKRKRESSVFIILEFKNKRFDKSCENEDLVRKNIFISSAGIKEIQINYQLVRTGNG